MYRLQKNKPITITDSGFADLNITWVGKDTQRNAMYELTIAKVTASPVAA